MVTINIAEQFSRTPGARYRKDGAFSGEEFREQLLAPAMAGADRITVILDGTRGFATSFLEEAFGGIARQFGAQECRKRLELVSVEDDLLIEEILGYIDAASN
jgi:hypothetical protein